MPALSFFHGDGEADGDAFVSSDPAPAKGSLGPVAAALCCGLDVAVAPSFSPSVGFAVSVAGAAGAPSIVN